MTRGAAILAGIMIVFLGAATWASYRGIGVPQPEKQPISIREESARNTPAGTGRYRTRFFLMGGGIHHGK